MALEVLSLQLLFIYLKLILKTSEHFYYFYVAVIFTQRLQIRHNISLLAVSLVYYFRIFTDYVGNPQDLHAAVILNRAHYKLIQTFGV